MCSATHPSVCSVKEGPPPSEKPRFLQEVHLKQIIFQCGG